MDELRKMYNELNNSGPAPKGFFPLAEDLDIRVYQHVEGIVGLASSYLAGKKIDPSRVLFDEELDQRLDKCLVRLNELIAYKKKHDALARLLIKELTKDSQS